MKTIIKETSSPLPQKMQVANSRGGEAIGGNPNAYSLPTKRNLHISPGCETTGGNSNACSLPTKRNLHISPGCETMNEESKRSSPLAKNASCEITGSGATMRRVPRVPPSPLNIKLAHSPGVKLQEEDCKGTPSKHQVGREARQNCWQYKKS